MNEITLQAIINETTPTLINQKFGKVFRLSKVRFAIDFRLPDSNYLFINLESAAPGLYLVKRRLKDLEKQSLNPDSFTLFVRKRISNAILKSLTKDENERIVRFHLTANDEIEGLKNYTFVVQLTGRSSNLYLLDDREFILDGLRENHGAGQEIASRFSAPLRDMVMEQRSNGTIFSKDGFESLSEALDIHFQQFEAERDFLAKVKSAEAKLRGEISKREKLKKKLLQDLENHGNAANWKKLGDLLLANLSTAVRIENQVLVVDYFDDNAPTIEIEVDENKSLTEAAEKFFKRYTKARNAKNEIEKRLEMLSAELDKLNLEKTRLEQAISDHDEQFLSPNTDEKSTNPRVKLKDKRDESFKGVRRYRSTDGFEILVGKASKDNDYLTFRIAKSLDFWLHAADYGGSHTVIRNPNRLDVIPTKTLIEAAQLAAYFSQAKAHSKAAVNYTQKKFVNKPKGAAAGLVSLSSFKTILVEPKESLDKL